MKSSPVSWPSGQVATVFGTDQKSAAPAEMRLTIPAQDVAVIHIR